MSIAVVTGAGGALGRAIACRLAADGHAIAAADIDRAAADATRTAVRERGGTATAHAIDLRDAAAIADLFAGLDASFVTGQTIEVNGGWIMV